MHLLTILSLVTAASATLSRCEGCRLMPTAKNVLECSRCEMDNGQWRAWPSLNLGRCYINTNGNLIFQHKCVLSQTDSSGVNV